MISTPVPCLQVEAWTQAIERLKLGTKCGILYVQTKETKAELLPKLQAIHNDHLDSLQVGNLHGISCNTACHHSCSCMRTPMRVVRFLMAYDWACVQLLSLPVPAQAITLNNTPDSLIHFLLEHFR
jgi:hypothetical protein